MGIPGLWDILGDGEITNIADLSAEHFARTGRPLRVAVDEAGWRFNNLNEFQVAMIRERVPQANPVEKAILWRLLRLMRLNIQFLFVFDGPSRPWKRGTTAGHIDWKKIDLLRKTLDVLKIPHHRAPAEAEAECARLQELGIVDAVWSDDGDSLMFGATVLIRDYREGGGRTTKKSDTLVRVYRADVIQQKHRINRYGLVLFALLSGGDYDTKGLEGCGPRSALQAAQFDNGRLPRLLYETPLRQLHCFTESLRDYFQNHSNKKAYVPPGYPRDLHVKNYREPKVSTLEQAHNLRGLKKGWDVAIQEDKLRPFLRERFDFWTRGYIKHVVPILLTKALVKTPPDGVHDNRVFNIEFVQKRGLNPLAPCKERRVTFSPLVATGLNLRSKPDTEDWGVFASKDGAAYDPSEAVEAELLNYVLEKGLGVTEMQRLKEEASKPKQRKRKANTDAIDLAQACPPVAAGDTLQSQSGNPANATRTTKKRKTGDNTAATSNATKSGSKKKADQGKQSEEVAATAPQAPCPPKTFRLPTVLQSHSSMEELLSERASNQEPLSRQGSFRSQFQPPPSSQDTISRPTPLHEPPSSQWHPEAQTWSSPVHQSTEQRTASKSKSKSRTPIARTTTKSSKQPRQAHQGLSATPDAASSSYHTQTAVGSTNDANATATPRRQVVVLEITSDKEDADPPTVMPRTTDRQNHPEANTITYAQHDCPPHGPGRPLMTEPRSTLLPLPDVMPRTAAEQGFLHIAPGGWDIPVEMPPAQWSTPHSHNNHQMYQRVSSSTSDPAGFAASPRQGGSGVDPPTTLAPSTSSKQFAVSGPAASPIMELSKVRVMPWHNSQAQEKSSSSTQAVSANRGNIDTSNENTRRRDIAAARLKHFEQLANAKTSGLAESLAANASSSTAKTIDPTKAAVGTMEVVDLTLDD